MSASDASNPDQQPGQDPMQENEILVAVVNQVGHLTLNRPAGLNTLTMNMVRVLHRQLQAWEDDDQVQVVVLRAVGEKAFCAGGDIRTLYDSYQSGGDLHGQFFDEEYALDQYLHDYPKPLVALINGIVLGGGMGLAQAANERLVTENSRVGMPEVGIGFFPDVGAGYFLSRLPGELGTYLGVTGNHITAADALYCGLADAYLPAADITQLDVSLGAVNWANDPASTLHSALGALTAQTLPDAPLAALRPAIDEHFAKASVHEIRQSLLAENRAEYREWAEKTVKIIDSRSPTSVAVALEHIRRGKHLSFSECLQEERALVDRFFDAGDFMEGVRALIVDKDKNPRWNPATLDEVTPDRVQSFFRKS